jgi:GH25 family lysozyme M1 (1,4-beta-N-acetylmuramidase)
MTDEFGFETGLAEADGALLEELLDRLEMQEGEEYESPGGGVQSPGTKVFFGLDTYGGDGNVNPDWVKARDEGSISFAIIKSNEGIWLDRSFVREWPRIKEAGVVRGAYLFLRFPNPNIDRKFGPPPSPAAQAQAFIRYVGNLNASDLPPSLDVEFPVGQRGTGMTPQQLLNGLRVAWKVLKDRYKAAPMVYTSARVWREDLMNLRAPDLLESPLWLARPYLYGLKQRAMRDVSRFAGGKNSPPVPPPWGDATNWWIHQYQPDASWLPGFRQVDMNRFNATAAGAAGDRVRWVQRRLGIAQSGTCDAATESALRSFQGKNGLEANGVIDPRTFAFLCWSNP